MKPTLYDKKILVIDDSEHDRAIIKKDLERAGFCNIIVAQTGEEGLERARRARPELIILDLMLPKKFGAEIARLIRNDPLTMSIPVIFLSGLCRPNERAQTVPGIPDSLVLAKTEDPAELIAAVTKALGA